jgi:hypothetical protein
MGSFHRTPQPPETPDRVPHPNARLSGGLQNRTAANPRNDPLRLPQPPKPHHLPLIRHLRLQFLENYHNLQHLSFNGRFDNLPSTVIETLQGLKHLDSLAIERPGSDWATKDILDKPYPWSMGPDIIKDMNPLKSLSISHVSDTRTYNLEPLMLAALANHKASLRNKTIHVHGRVKEDFVRSLLDFISTSNITTLSIRLRIPKGLRDLDFKAYFPVDLKSRRVDLVKAEQWEIQQLPWMSEILNLDMSGPVELVERGGVPIPDTTPSTGFLAFIESLGFNSDGG